MFIDVASPIVEVLLGFVQSALVANHKQGVFSTGYRYVHSFLASYEPNVTVVIGPDASHDDNVSFLTLEGIDCTHFQQVFVVLFFLNHSFDTLYLTLVGSNYSDTDVFIFHEQFIDEKHHNISL